MNKNMIYLKGIYDSNSKRLMIEYKNNLLETHFNLLKNFIEDSVSSSVLPEGTEIKSLESNKCVIIVPVEIKNGGNLKDGERIDTKNIPGNVTEKISEIIDNFRRKARKIEFETTEFIPLQGYPIESLQWDIKKALVAKRDFCVVDKFSSYKLFSSGQLSSINQYKTKYMEDEYCKIALMIYEGKLKDLKNLLKDKLQSREWE